METQTLAALGAVLLGLMAFALYLFYTRRKSVAEFNRRKEQRDDVTLHVRLGDISERKMSGSEPKDVEIAELKSKLGTTEIMLRESHGELTQARDTITALTAERDNYRELWEKELDRATKFYRECERLDKLAEGYHDKVVSLESKCRWAVQERDEARAFANDLSEQLDRALAVIKDLEGVNAELLAMVQGEDEVHPEAKPLRLVTDLGENECIHCPTEPEAEAICKLMHEAGLKWGSGIRLLHHNNWIYNLKDTVYYPEGVEYGSIQYAQQEGNTIHPASDFLPPEFYAEEQQPATTEPAIDWTKPVAFPEGYKVPKGCRIIAIKDIYNNIKPGTKGITIETNIVPFCNFDDGTKTMSMFSEELAPENPADHPWHPEFKGKKTENN